nr:nucleolar transcription factor 1-A-like [Nerophis lumbriciformis]
METAWTDETLLKLLNAVKSNIPEPDRMKAFSHGVNTLNWENVAFPPFSAKDCLEKWRVVSRKMRKIRTLTELVDEAVDQISNSTKKPPKRPSLPIYVFYNENFYKYQALHPELSPQGIFSLVSEKYNGLTEEEKAPYVEQYHRAHAEYSKLRKKAAETALDDQNASENEANSMESTEDAQPPKPPGSGYHLFCKEQAGSMQGVPKNDYVATWAQRWRQLSDAERSAFSTRHLQMKEDYARKCRHYLSKRQKLAAHQINKIQEDYRPSDSEDEDLEVSSSSDEEQECFTWDEDDENDVNENIFDVF